MPPIIAADGVPADGVRVPAGRAWRRKRWGHSTSSHRRSARRSSCEPDAYVELGQDGTGCATVEGLEPGDYTVWAAWRGGLVRGPDVRVDDSGPHLARVELTGEASLCGAIQKRTPGGLEDVTWFLGLELRHETLPIGTHALVDGDGRHSFPVLPPGRWRLGDRAQRVPVQLRPGDNHRDVVVAPNLD